MEMMRKDADTQARTKEMIDSIKREAQKIQDELINGTLKVASKTTYGSGFGAAKHERSASEIGFKTLA